MFRPIKKFFSKNKKKQPEKQLDGTFDSDRWLAEFKEAARTRNYEDLHGLRVEIIKDTFEKLDNGWYISYNGNKVEFEENDLHVIESVRSVEQHIFQDGFPKLPPMSERPYKVTEVFVRDADCVVEAIKMLDEGMKAAVINMANAYSPGGGYLHGAGAQEENLFRRSNCNDFLDPERRNSNSNLYPIPECGGNYVPGVTVFRGKESDGYPLLDVPKKLDVLTVAALAHPSVHIDQATGRYVMSEEETKITYNKIRVLYEMARIHKNDGIVLSAIGCGAFRNPPWQVAELFLKVTKKYYGFFKRIVFAIFGKQNNK